MHRFILTVVFILSLLIVADKSKVDRSTVFVILAHERNEEQSLLWKRCYNSVREFYPDIPIVIIDVIPLCPFQPILSGIPL